jgi:hypothetical protein
MENDLDQMKTRVMGTVLSTVVENKIGSRDLEGIFF